MKQRIGLFLSAKPHLGGAFQFSQSVLEALSSLPANRFDRVAAYTDDVWSESLATCSIPGMSLHSSLLTLFASKRLAEFLPLAWWRAAFAPHLRSIKVMLRQQCKLWIFPAQETFSYLTPVPSLATIFDLMHRYERRFKESAGYGLYRCREKHYGNVCRWSRGVLVDSEVGKNHVIESYHLDAERLFVLPFVPPHYIRSSRAPEAFDRRYNLPQKFLFYPAQFWEHKNHKALVAAAALLKKDIPDLTLVFVGSQKNGYASTWKLVQRLGLCRQIRFLGYVPGGDMPEFYLRARALIMPTFFGPTNIPPLEAMALGCPVAVSRIYGMPEQLGDAAYYFDPASVQEICQTMKALWQNVELCRSLALKGAEQSSRWTQAHFNECFRRIIEHVLKSENSMSPGGASASGPGGRE